MNDGLSEQPAARMDGQNEEKQEVAVPSAEAQSRAPETPLEALADVTLRLDVRLGETTLLIRQVLSLCPGSIVTLNKRPDDLVDVTAGDRLIARGEIVVVDGELGVRIVEIPGEGAREDERSPGAT